MIRAPRVTPLIPATALGLVALLAAGPGAPARLSAQSKPTIDQFMGEPSPLSIVAARHADRLAWRTFERGMRNVYTAAAPDFKAVRLTPFLKDDGTDLGDVNISDDGSIIVFVRGSAPNRDGWVANPSHYPTGMERAIWAVRSSGGAPWRVAEGSAPELSPDGRYVLFVKDGQIYRGRVAGAGPRTAMDTGGVPFIREWGEQSEPRWSPDGRKVAFVSGRQNHAFIAVYDTRTRAVDYLAPSVDCDGSFAWSPDSKRIAFVRRPGTPFGLQAQPGNPGIGNPPGPRAGRGGGNPLSSGCFSGFRFGGGFGQEEGGRMPRTPGLYTSAFSDGSTLQIMIADVSACPGKAGACTARAIWHNDADDRKFAGIARLIWADDNILFPLSPADDEWDRYYTISASHPSAPAMLTTTDGLIEGPGSAALSRDGKTLYYCTNAQDIEKRHIWAVPTAGGTPVRVSTDDGVETSPQPLASGRQIAVLYFDARRPASVGLVPTAGGATKVVYPTLPKDFPLDAHVTPQIVIVTSPDSLQIHNQLFLPKDLKPGERRPALIFVHGGPIREMLPAYHYMQFYHWAYAFNQWLTSQGYIVMSVNYRGGIGYGRSFRFAPNTNARGNAEYQDVLAAAKYLQSRPDVDPARVGIWGLSYGGLLTSQALARNSDVFVAGADLAGVHLYGSSLDTTALSYQSSAISAIDTWKSPVYIVQGDDDRNVSFAQSVGLVQLLRAHGVHYELEIIPDDLHESMLYSRWLVTWNNVGGFLEKYVRNKEVAATNR